MSASLKKRSLIWNYFIIDKEDEKTAICNNCKERLSWGGSSVKNFNTTNLRNHLRHFHHDMLNELLVKEREDAEKKEEEQKGPWHYDHPEHIKVTK